MQRLPSALFVWVADSHVRSDLLVLALFRTSLPDHPQSLVLSGAFLRLPSLIDPYRRAAQFFSTTCRFRRKFIRRCSSLVTSERRRSIQRIPNHQGLKPTGLNRMGCPGRVGRPKADSLWNSTSIPTSLAPRSSAHWGFPLPLDPCPPTTGVLCLGGVLGTKRNRCLSVFPPYTYIVPQKLLPCQLPVSSACKGPRATGLP